MSERPYNMPPLGALVSFEAAARHVSFKSAATELNVTPAAISHQVKALERDLGCALFRRHHRGVDLTETGAYLLVVLQRGFEDISDALDQLRRRPARASVTIRATTAVSSIWLTPRLAHFWRIHPTISVAQILSDTDQALTDCDLSIHYGDIGSETGKCHALFRDRIAALCSPRFAQTNRIASVADLARLPLIHLDSEHSNWTGWHEWCATLGYSGPLRHSHRVNNYVIALQAAQDDMGVVLGWDGLTRPLVDAGRLVRILPDTIESPLDFYVKLHPHATERARLVYDWLKRDGANGEAPA